MENQPKLIPDLMAADTASAAAVAAIMLIELKNTVSEIEERIESSTASRTDLIETEAMAKRRSEQQMKALK